MIRARKNLVKFSKRKDFSHAPQKIKISPKGTIRFTSPSRFHPNRNPEKHHSPLRIGNRHTCHLSSCRSVLHHRNPNIQKGKFYKYPSPHFPLTSELRTYRKGLKIIDITLRENDLSIPYRHTPNRKKTKNLSPPIPRETNQALLSAPEEFPLNPLYPLLKKDFLQDASHSVPHRCKKIYTRTEPSSPTLPDQKKMSYSENQDSENYSEAILKPLPPHKRSSVN